MLDSIAVEAVGKLLEKYPADLRENKSVGSPLPETSYYPALRELLNNLGATLKPTVRCVIHSHGAGFPDRGLFTPDQFQNGIDPLPGTMPSRGAREAEPTTSRPDVRSCSGEITGPGKCA